MGKLVKSSSRSFLFQAGLATVAVTVAPFALSTGPRMHAQAQTAPAAAPAPAATLAPAKDADSKEIAHCLVRNIHALHQGNAFDAQLEPLRAQLQNPALSAWKSFRQLDKQELDLQLSTATPGNFTVPGDHRGTLQFVNKVEKDGKLRLRLRLELFDGAAKLLSTTVLIDNGGTLLQAGTKHQGGMLVLGFTCQLKKS